MSEEEDKKAFMGLRVAQILQEHYDDESGYIKKILDKPHEELNEVQKEIKRILRV